MYHNVEEMLHQRKFYGGELDNMMEFITDCKRSVEVVGNHLSGKENISWLLNILKAQQVSSII